MRRVASSVVPVVLALLGAPTRADAPPDRARAERSKIVRVERPGASTGGAFMFCDIKPALEGECISSTPPRAGDRVEVIDDRERVAELRVKGATQRTTRDPTCTIMWDVQFDGDGTDLSGTHGGQLTGLAGIPVERTGHRMNPVNGGGQLKIPTEAGGGGEENVMIGVDKNGDGDMDIAVTLFNCANPNAPPGNYSGADFCVNIWTIDHGRYKRIQQITAAQLQPCLRS